MTDNTVNIINASAEQHPFKKLDLTKPIVPAYSNSTASAPQASQPSASEIRRKALEEAAEALRKLALERGAITVMHMQECLRALAQVPAQSRYCGACEQYVTEPCNSIDCSTPEFCQSQEQQAPAQKPCECETFIECSGECKAAPAQTGEG